MARNRGSYCVMELQRYFVICTPYLKEGDSVCWVYKTQLLLPDTTTSNGVKSTKNDATVIHSKELLRTYPNRT